MGLGDKIENAAETASGRGREAAGNATGDESLRAEGKTDQAQSDVTQAEKVEEAPKGEKIHEALKHEVPGGF